MKQHGRRLLAAAARSSSSFPSSSRFSLRSASDAPLLRRHPVYAVLACRALRAAAISGAPIRSRDEAADGSAAASSDPSSLMIEREFHNVANQTLHHLQERIDEMGEKLAIEGFDTDYSEGVLTVRLGDLGTYVINKQTPNRQIWLSSPVSGPARFDWSNSKWVYKRTKSELYELLQRELQQLVGRPVQLSSGD